VREVYLGHSFDAPVTGVSNIEERELFGRDAKTPEELERDDPVGEVHDDDEQDDERPFGPDDVAPPGSR
jgi:hypothetical protein